MCFCGKLSPENHIRSISGSTKNHVFGKFCTILQEKLRLFFRNYEGFWEKMFFLGTFYPKELLPVYEKIGNTFFITTFSRGKCLFSLKTIRMVWKNVF